jgi:hypothetical protein
VPFNHTYRYIDDVISINDHNFHNYVHLIYPDEPEIKDTIESEISASYLHVDTILNTDLNGRLTTTSYDRLDAFNFAIVNFPFLCTNTPLSPAYHVKSPSWFDTQEHVLRLRIFQSEANYWNFVVVVGLYNIFEVVFTICHKYDIFNHITRKLLHHTGNSYVTRRKQLYHLPEIVISPLLSNSSRALIVHFQIIGSGSKFKATVST